MDPEGVPSGDDAPLEPVAGTGEPLTRGEEPPDLSSVVHTGGEGASPVPHAPVRVADRILSLAEVVLCSGFPTQLAVTVVLLTWGIKAVTSDGTLSLAYVVWLSAADTALVLVLALLFLRLRGEQPSAVLLGTRPLAGEALRGVLLLAPTFALLVGAALTIQRLAPWLKNAGGNPFQDLLRTPLGTAMFACVAIIAGGLREEVQRAFVLHRFEQHLGGIWLGLAVFSIAFGAGHILQGYDAAIMTGILGALWGYVYIRRRSLVAPVVCHAMFNLVEVLFHGSQP